MYFYEFIAYFSPLVKTGNLQSERQKTSHRNLLVNNERFWQKYSYTPSPYYRRGGGGGMGGGWGEWASVLEFPAAAAAEWDAADSETAA